MSVQERKKNPSAFLRNIFNILQNTQLNSIIEWAPNGNGFVIKNLDKFESQILPQYFKHKKYSSFVRQLNMYGFHKQRNSIFDNCFLHAQFRRGEELPTDIKRKPEKKKKAGETQGDQVQKQSNWASFSKELKLFLPQIAESILVKKQPTKYILTIQQRDQNHSQDQQQLQFQPMENLEQQEEEYVSKISLRGLIDQFEENPQSIIKKEKNQIQKCMLRQQDNYESMKNESESDVNYSCDKEAGDKLMIVQNVHSGDLDQNHMSNPQNPSRQAHFSAESISFLQGKMDSLSGTIDSLSGLSEVLIRQNQILRKTHPIIRKIVLNTQQNKINYLKTQIQAQDTEQRDLKDKITPLEDILEQEKHRLEELIEVLQKQVEGLVQSVLEEDMPISNTSIRFRLEKNV